MSSRPGRELFHAAHYNMLAKRIRELKEEFVKNDPANLDVNGAEEVLDLLTIRLSNWFEQDNPRFERDTWFDACNPIKWRETH